MWQFDCLEIVIAVEGFWEDHGDIVLAQVKASHDFEVAECFGVHILNAAVLEADYLQVEQPCALEDIFAKVSDGVIVED